LPAVPKAWSDGSFRGLRARGGVEVDLTWRDGRATSAVLKTSTAGSHRVRAPQGQMTVSLTADGRDVPFRMDNEVVTFRSDAGRTYHMRLK